MIFLTYGTMTRYSNNLNSFSNIIKYPVKIRRGGGIGLSPRVDFLIQSHILILMAYYILIHTRKHSTCSYIYIYITLYSAYPPGLTKCLIFGHLQTYCNQNYVPTDFLSMAKLLFTRLNNREYQSLELKTCKEVYVMT